MPDLTIQYFYHCETAEHFSQKVEGSKGKQHVVTYGPAQRGPYQYDYSCSCDSFKFGKGKPCKHIEEVKKNGDHCNWQQFIDGGDPVEKDGEKRCPKCGAAVRSQGHGV